MRKVLVSCLILAALLALSMSVPALASVGTPNEEVVEHIENVDAHILREIEKAQKLADMALEKDNAEEVEEIIADLLEKTSKLVALCQEWASEKGITIVSFWHPVVIGGVDVLVDPIHVLW